MNYQPAGFGDNRTARWGAVIAFMIVYIVSYIDRQAMTIVFDPVKASLGISDTQIGLLQGSVFTTVLMIVAIPMAYLVDRFNRITILISCVVIWSMATILCGFSRSYFDLIACRIGLAIAEAVVPIAAMSVIGDLFPREQVGRAAAVFMNGSYFGNGASMLLCGWLTELFEPFQGEVVPLLGRFETWRGLFIAIGFLSMLVAIGLYFYVKEPARREITLEKIPESHNKEFFHFFWDNRQFILSYCLFAGFISFIGYSLYAWTATILIRVHHFSAPEAGMIMGPLFIITSVPGTFIAAWLGSRCRPENAMQHLIKVMIILDVMLTPCVGAIPLASNSVLVVLIGLILLIYVALHASLLVPMQLLSPNRMRGRMGALTSTIWVIPAGNSPLIIGWLTDRVFADPLAIDRAMAIALGVAGLCAAGSGMYAWRQARLTEKGNSLWEAVALRDQPALVPGR